MWARVNCITILVAVVATFFLGSLIGQRLFFGGLGYSHSSKADAVVVLPNNERDLGAVSQGKVLQASFAVSNAGNRRLILLEETGTTCCGQAAGPRQLIVAPGDSRDLIVKLNTAQWHGMAEQIVHYTTNDPKTPKFALRVTAIVGGWPQVPSSKAFADRHHY